MSESEPTLRGQLLVATPGLTDPNFARAVVLIVEHGDDGALGIVLNRPSNVDAAGAVPDWGQLAASPPVVFAGGPVEPDAVVAIGRARSLPAAGWRPIGGGLGLVDLAVGRGETAVDAIRFFAGYAGWAAGQLEAEVAAGAWFVFEAEDADALTAEPDELWRAVVTRQGGVYANFPLDPALN